MTIFVSEIQAQQLHNNVYISNSKAYQSEDTLVIEMTIDGSKAKLSSNESVVLTPVIKTDNNIKELSPVIISGNTRYKADKRTRFFRKDNLKENSDFLQIKNTSSVDYKQQIAYEEWMQNAALSMKQSITGCAECFVSENWDVIGNVIYTEKVETETPSTKFVVSYIAPKGEDIKNRNYEGSAFLDFQVGKSVIIPEFRDNYTEINKIENVLNQLKTDNNTTIRTILLVGVASPEGSFQTNSRLSLARAQALKIYLQRKYDFRDSLFNIEQKGEDWSGLDRLVSESYLSDKDRILEVINSSVSEDMKEQKLKTLGTTYKILLEEYFPKLRRVDYKLNYVVRAFSIEEGRDIITTKPGQMSLNEMFLVANSYAKGSQKFKEVFDIAVRIFPEDAIANINAAAIALEIGDTKAAHKYLDNYKEVSASWNNQGVLYAIEGDLTKAKEFFLKAQNEGITESSENIKIVNKIEVRNKNK